MHLSTLMTPDHRRERVAEARRRLKDKSPLRLVATSLVEAGVDVSFPVVFRALSGIDSIAQAAGRCNRENELGREGGRVYLFEPAATEGRTPPRDVKQLADAARTILRDHADPLSLDAVRVYFEEVYWRRGPEQLDAVDVGGRYRGIVEAIEIGAHKLNFDFADIAQAFRVIESVMVPVIIPSFDGMAHGAPRAWLDELRYAPRPGGACRRALQRASVQVPPKVVTALKAAGAVSRVREEDFGDQFVVLDNLDLYGLESGLDWSDSWRRATSFRNLSQSRG